MKYLTLFILLFALLVTTIAAQPKLGVFYPDDSDNIITLRGRTSTITLDADNGEISLSKNDKKIILSIDDRAVIGIRDPNLPNMSAVIFESRGSGYLQLRNRDGAEVFSLEELK